MIRGYDGNSIWNIINSYVHFCCSKDGCRWGVLMNKYLCGGKLPVELSSSIQAVTIPCPSRYECARYSEEVKLPIALYYNRFEKVCVSFIGK